MKKLILLFVILFIFSITFSQIINIPDDYPTIQQGIDAAIDGDTVLVQPGTYVENINFNGKNITVASHYLTTLDTSYISQTIIDGDNDGNVVRFESGEDSTTLLCGFKLTGGYAPYGGGIYCYESGPVLDHLIISDCLAESYWGGTGGGIYCSKSDPIINNLTISDCSAGSYWGGGGGGIYLWNSSATILNTNVMGNTTIGGYGNEGIGGGIYCSHDSNPVFENLLVAENTSEIGGGMYIADSSLSIFKNVTLINNTASSQGGGIYIADATTLFDSINKCNIYQNWALTGKDIYKQHDEQIIHLVLDTFSVLYPSDYYIESLKNFTFDISHGLKEQVDANLYISPNGNNENSGLTESDPLKTIDFAFSIIRADSMHIHTIHLLDGTYSDSTTGEIFPVNVIDDISLQGISDSTVILDAENQSQVLSIINNDSTVISNMKLTGGIAPTGGGLYCSNSSPLIFNVSVEGNVALSGWYSEGNGGGMYFVSSYPSLQHVEVKNNSASDGAGIYLRECVATIDSSVIAENTGYDSDDFRALGAGIYAYQSNLNLTNSIIRNNNFSDQSYYYEDGPYGGGILISHSNIDFKNVLVVDNQAYSGGGIYFSGKTYGNLKNVTIIGNEATKGGAIYWNNDSIVTFDTTDRCNIYGNSALYGNDLYANKMMEVVVDTFSVINPTEYFADPYENFVFDILNGKIEQVNADLYVSPDGNNNNSGLDADNPLKTIHWAISKMLVDSLNQHTIHLKEGVYKHSLRGEFFPINIPDFVSIEGENDSTTILDAEYNSGVILIDHNQYNKLNEITITGGDTLNNQIGTGIHCVQSSPELSNLIVTGNGGGAGIMIIEHSNPTLFNVEVSNNISTGIYCADASSPLLDHVIISNNSGDWRGGGLSCYSHSSPALQNVTIKNNVSVHMGGGVFCSNSNPTLNNVSIIGNHADWNGGGIYFTDDSEPVLSNLIITENTADYGAGMTLENVNPIMNDVLITKNIANHRGGGISFFGSCDSIISEGIMVSENQASVGSGVYVSNAEVNLVNMVISDNGNDESYGGGLDINNDSKVFLSNVSVRKNRAVRGGGISLFNSSLIFDSINRCNIYLNEAGSGRDLYSYETPVEVIVDTFTVLYPNELHALYLENFTFDINNGLLEQFDADFFISPDGDNNNSGLTPGDPMKNLGFALSKMIANEENQNTIYLMEGYYSPSTTGEIFPIHLPDYVYMVGNSPGEVILDSEGISPVIELYKNTHNLISGLTVKGSNGAGINCSYSNPILANLDIIDNGYGIYCSNSTPFIEGVKAANNESIGIYCSNSTPFIQDVKVLSNGSTGISFEDVNEATIKDAQILDNDGRGLYCKHSNLLISNATITGNTNGGAFFTYSGLVFIDGTIKNNASNKGGGMYVHVSNLKAENLLISNNAANYGGGVYDYHSETSLLNSLIIDNQANISGGGIQGAKGQTTIINSLVANNEAPQGGAIFSELYWESEFINSTIVFNTAEEGGGIYARYISHPTLINTIVWGNTEQNIFFKDEVASSFIDVLFSNVQGGKAGIVANDTAAIHWLEGNLDEYPLFIADGDFSFALSYNSPCIDAGTPDTTGLLLPLFDLLGSPRIWNNRIDIGTVEWNSLGAEELETESKEQVVRCYPNPFSTSTTIEYELKQPETVTLTIYDYMGKQVYQTKENQAQGTQQLIWNAEGYAEGVYYYKLQVGDAGCQWEDGEGEVMVSIDKHS